MAEKKDERQQCPALDGVSSSPGVTVLRSNVEADRFSSSGEDAAGSRGETEQARDVAMLTPGSTGTGIFAIAKPYNRGQ